MIRKPLFFLRHSAPARWSLVVENYLAKHNVTALEHPPYSPYLSPLDFRLFPVSATKRCSEITIRERRTSHSKSDESADGYRKLPEALKALLMLCCSFLLHCADLALSVCVQLPFSFNEEKKITEPRLKKYARSQIYERWQIVSLPKETTLKTVFYR
jgi:hypothetical protein